MRKRGWHSLLTVRNILLRLIIFGFGVGSILLGIGGCYRGSPSDKPPIHLNKNMDSQEKYKAQSESRFFEDGSAMRIPPQGTVARGQLREDAAFFGGVNEEGKPVQVLPVPITLDLLKRGRQRYDIYCSVCHGRVGDGKGIVVKRGYLPPPTFHDDRLRNVEDGYIFGVISNGIRNMPAYKYQIPPDDRWAIVAYLRALQRSQSTTINDIPERAKGKSE